MDQNNLTQFTESLVQESLFGLGIVTLVLLMNTALISLIFVTFKKYCQQKATPNLFHLCFRLIASMLLICTVELLAILVWTGAIYYKGLVNELTVALLFAGSCFTTIGVYSDNLPFGWRFVAIYIAFSGLFSFAIATASLISMINWMGKAMDIDRS